VFLTEHDWPDAAATIAAHTTSARAILAHATTQKTQRVEITKTMPKILMDNSAQAQWHSVWAAANRRQLRASSSRAASKRSFCDTLEPATGRRLLRACLRPVLCVCVCVCVCVSCLSAARTRTNHIGIFASPPFDYGSRVSGSPPSVCPLHG